MALTINFNMSENQSDYSKMENTKSNFTMLHGSWTKRKQFIGQFKIIITIIITPCALNESTIFS